jgi:hypothetical protein
MNPSEWVNVRKPDGMCVAVRRSSIVMLEALPAPENNGGSFKPARWQSRCLLTTLVGPNHFIQHEIIGDFDVLSSNL